MGIGRGDSETPHQLALSYAVRGSSIRMARCDNQTRLMPRTEMAAMVVMAMAVGNMIV